MALYNWIAAAVQCRHARPCGQALRAARCGACRRARAPASTLRLVPCLCVVTSLWAGGMRPHLALVAPAARKRVHAQPGSHAAGHLARVLVAARILHAL